MGSKLKVIKSALVVHHISIKMVLNPCTCNAHHVHMDVNLSSISTIIMNYISREM